MTLKTHWHTGHVTIVLIAPGVVSKTAQEFEISNKSKEQQYLVNATLSADFSVFNNNLYHCFAVRNQ
jgi:hypothetical protein